MVDNIKAASSDPGEPQKQATGQGLRGKDKQQAGLRDERGGSYDDGTVGVPERARDVDLPEGLKRQRQGPYNKDTGRAPASRKGPQKAD